ncbi:MAG: toxin-antitoxin system TumE family protein [Candidatus Helarchaeota archaeon]
MPRTLELLKKSPAVKTYEILDFKQGKNFYFLKVKADLVDGGEIYIREFVSENEFIYSYHWQDKNEKLRIRWDNAPHHKHLKTFPHHKHLKTFPHHKHTPEVEESIDLSEESFDKLWI